MHKSRQRTQQQQHCCRLTCFLVAMCFSMFSHSISITSGHLETAASRAVFDARESNVEAAAIVASYLRDEIGKFEASSAMCDSAPMFSIWNTTANSCGRERHDRASHTQGIDTHTWLAQSLTSPPCEASPIPAVATSSSGCDMAANRFITATILSFDCIKVSHSARGVCSGATVSCGRSAMTVAAALPALHTPTWPRQPASPSPPPPHGKATHALQRCCGLIRPRSAPWKGGCSFPVVCVA